MPARSRARASSAVATFTATLSAATAYPVTFRYSTQNGTASAGIDYTATSGTYTLGAGQVTASLSVPVLATTVASASKYFYLDLSSPMNATLGVSQGLGTILNSNHTAYITVDDTSVTASTTTAGTMNFAVRLLSPATFPVTLDYATNDGSATALAGDYTTTDGTLTFVPGTTSQTVSVPISTRTVHRAHQVLRPEPRERVGRARPSNAPRVTATSVGRTPPTTS